MVLLRNTKGREDEDCVELGVRDVAVEVFAKEAAAVPLSSRKYSPTLGFNISEISSKADCNLSIAEGEESVASIKSELDSLISDSKDKKGLGFVSNVCVSFRFLVSFTSNRRVPFCSENPPSSLVTGTLAGMLTSPLIAFISSSTTVVPVLFVAVSSLWTLLVSTWIKSLDVMIKGFLLCEDGAV